MLFNSIEFFIFLPIVFVLYWFVFNKNVKRQNVFILVASYTFYGWWNWRFLILIAFTSFCSWLSGFLIEEYRGDYRKAKCINAANIIVNLLILGVFKYYDFFIQSFADVFLGGKADGLLLRIILPVGISFYTFQALSYSIDVYRNKLQPTKDVIQFFAFVAFFPQLVAGPIERATNLLPQFARARIVNYEQITSGLRQALWGLFKKMVIADNLAVYVNLVFNDVENYSGFPLIWAAIFFTFQIYADFSGYSDIAIGTARIFGFDLMTNFRQPYLSRSIKEFWNRWHISLSSWFRDYVYIPLGGNRVSYVRHCANLFITFTISGLWHGANWTFVIWGAYYGVLLILEKLFCLKSYKIDDSFKINHLPKVVCTFVIVVFGWALFRANTLSDVWYIYGNIFKFNSGIIGVPLVSVKTFIMMLLFIWLLFTVDFCKQIVLKREMKKIWRVLLVFLQIVGIYTLGVFEEQSFIYFQF
ncbi:MAG: MBOAT family protein [Salinivirgaceae bacterium]|nr:MBOAT family protein [Salinivirgaceae bacterium]